MNNIGYLNVLNDDRENRKLLTKLPDWMVNRWSRIVTQYRDEHRSFPPFAKFVEFLEKEAKIANDPVTSIQSLKPDAINNQRGQLDNGRKFSKFGADKRETARRNAFATETTTNIDRNKTEHVRKDNCFLCHNAHKIDECE